MQKITTFLWFNDNAEEAANFYTSTFKNSRITSASRYGEGAPGKAGSVMTIAFEIEGQQFTALNGGPHFKFTEAISLVVHCENQEEIDYYWEKLTSGGGQEGQCGWLKDQFGLSWQVVPAALSKLVGGGDAARSGRVMGALMKMKKLDIAALQAAGDAA
jgi:predicted 3-demethylubiquinone-9 3-methyltransferase (glyoxalase superfamily)